jgi:hypothetical protein
MFHNLPSTYTYDLISILAQLCNVNSDIAPIAQIGKLKSK